jgi:hypothetical protein
VKLKIEITLDTEKEQDAELIQRLAELIEDYQGNCDE